MLCTGSEVLSWPLVVKCRASSLTVRHSPQTGDDRSGHDRQRTSDSLAPRRTSGWMMRNYLDCPSGPPYQNCPYQAEAQLAQYGKNCEYKLRIDTVPNSTTWRPAGSFLRYCTSTGGGGGTTDFPTGSADKTGGGRLTAPRARAGVQPFLWRLSAGPAGAPILRGQVRSGCGPPELRGRDCTIQTFKGRVDGGG